MAMLGGAGEDPDRGRRIGKYEILTRLSMGGMAELFLAFTSGPGGFRKFVAVKQILPDIKKDEQFVKMFLDEARITAAFSHANIGQVFDLGEEGGELYLAMEFLPGQNLEQVVKATARQGYALPMGFIGRVIRDACLGLHYAHHFTDPSGRPAVVVHRDVSPKNVMLTYDGVVKVIDFGIAKARGRLGRTQVGTVKGTSGYMSPEQVRGAPLDGRSDLFSVGVMLHELLCGQRLFNGPHEAAVMLQIVESDIPAPRSINPDVPEALEAVALRALSRDASQRFTSGREMSRAIEAALGSELFDEDGITAVMGDLFADKRQKTRTLLELASSAEDARVSEVAGALQQDDGGGDSAPTAQVPAKRTRLAPSVPTESATPTRAGSGPKPVPQRRPTEAAATRVAPASSGSGPKPVPQRRPTEAAAPTPRPPRPAQDAAPITRTPRPRPAPRQEAPEAEAAETFDEPSDLATQRFRTRPPRPGARPAARAAPRSDTPMETPAARPASRWVGRLFLLALLGGLGWLATLPMVRAQFVPAYESAKAWVKAELDPAPPVDPAASGAWPPPQKAGPPPGFPRGVEETPPATEPAVAADTEAPAPSEEGQGTRPDSKATRSSPGRKAKDGATASREPSGTDTGRTVKRARTPAEAAAPEPVTTVTQNPDDVGEVLDTSTPKGAAKAGLGWLTLQTVPRAAVFDGATQLGTTPLQKMPLPVGTYRLRVVDPTDAEAASRLLSAPVKPGEVTKIQIRLADLPLYKE
ncbi:protein kinase domain-containing protein [Pyxidicoccus sp. MSG2]|uniref:protein kinase domain-containing protein n=1 Tax=Pyxidicoccus sp. MSG2 TaxID=2996790 RepID=UPI002271A9F3|nr:protein kinase [Pyxidicoccus sp. MSG2]MCY1014715.1 protein kinase [Pyxidicoccus sp. MSG2]